MKRFILFFLIFTNFCTPVFSKERLLPSLIATQGIVESEEGEEDALLDQREYFEFDIGLPILFGPANSYRKAYSDASLSVGARIATSYTRNRFRGELGYLYQKLSDGTPSISNHNNQSVRLSESDMEVHQTELLFFWLKNEENRVAFIGGGPISLRVKENFKVIYQESGRSHSFHDSTLASGYKLVVGGKDNNSLLKTTFSYTQATVDSKFGKKYTLGGYAFTFHLSFGSI